MQPSLESGVELLWDHCSAVVAALDQQTLADQKGGECHRIWGEVPLLHEESVKVLRGAWTLKRFIANSVETCLPA